MALNRDDLEWDEESWVDIEQSLENKLIQILRIESMIESAHCLRDQNYHHAKQSGRN